MREQDGGLVRKERERRCYGRKPAWAGLLQGPGIAGSCLYIGFRQTHCYSNLRQFEPTRVNENVVG